MKRGMGRMRVIALGAIVLLPGVSSAVTRQIADLQPTRLTFDRSVLNQLSDGTYRDPFDELQTRPYNLLFSNIARLPNLCPWQGQQGSYTRYLNALIGNNGASNVDNNADSIQGGLIRRETASLAWGASASYLAGSSGSDDANGTTTFTNADDLTGFDLRGAMALQLSQSAILGVGIRAIQAGRDLTEGDFEPGIGGFASEDDFEQSGFSVDAGMRHFLTTRSSWDARLSLGIDGFTQETFSDDIDDTGAVTDRFVTTNYEVDDRTIGIEGGYNRLKLEGLGETEFRGGLQLVTRELGNSDLSYSDAGGVITPSLTLLDQEPITATRLYASARSIFQAGETEMFLGGQLGLTTTDGSTLVDAAGTPVTEEIDDSQSQLTLTVGLRQPFFNDKLRFIVSGRADWIDLQQRTTFDTSSASDDSTLSTAQYAIGLEAVLANVTLDFAWLVGDEAPVTPVVLGLPQGSRRAVSLDRVVFSAAVAW